jgi:hypothetical protein
MKFEQVINATLVLFILSLITEKVANFIKLHSTRLAIPQNSLLFETSRTRAIQKRTILIGIFIALLCKANLFDLFNQDTTLFWERNDLPFFTNNEVVWNEDFIWLKFLSVIVGAALTGLFLSFGSKFFHDLLDLLLEAKNLKRKLAERADWNFDTTAEIDNYILTNDSAEAKEKIREQLLRFEGIEYYRIDYPQKLIYVFARDKEKIATQIDIPGALNMASFKVVFLKDKVREIKALATVKPTLQIANAKPYNNNLHGTCGLMVQAVDSNDKYILTCYHAVWNPSLKWSGYVLEPECKIHSPLKGNEIGKLYIGIKNYKLDIALIRPGNGITLTNQMPLNKIPKAIRTLSENDVKGGTRLSIVSHGSPGRYLYGVCANVNCTANITYPDGVKRDLQKLYQIESLQKEPFSIAGDSGSLIMDEFDYAVGILVAGDEKTTSFAMPIASILNAYNLKLLI